MKQKRIAIAGMTAALLVGAGTGVVLNLPSGAGAGGTSNVSAAVTPNTDDTTADTGTGTDAADDAGDHKPGQFLADSLATLVTDGTITQAQADAITASIEANRPQGRPGDGDGDGDGDGRGHAGPGMGGRHGGRGPGLDIAATALGMTIDELRTELQSGKSLAEVATAKGVPVQTVIDALVAEATTRITDMVNGVHPADPADSAANG